MIRAVEDMKGLEDCLDAIPSEVGLKDVRRLHFDSIHTHDDRWMNANGHNEVIELMKRCSGLTYVCLGLDFGFLVSSLDWSQGPTMEELIEEYRLEEIFKCKKLEHIEMPMQYCDVDKETPKALREWIRDGFEKRGRKVSADLVLWYEDCYIYGPTTWLRRFAKKL
ncbi:hypothetical protein BU16DRAFT_541439 [Lophium mytilinum]|uniref:F-box domain-containing protein n=1 Tax=Lophium mytilinum TaxID=390894 RepID=A0A6A6QKS8_9PEZI|nr:hypothetical protein BU16DRAFT_541439 [Lophium mytilinum]